jgi:agmatinase
MRLWELVCIALSFSSPLVVACEGDHTRQVREWSQEELDELEDKWGTDVSYHHICPDYSVEQGWV